MYATEEGVLNAQMNTETMRQLPHVLMRPRVYPDGNMWCALYGENLQEGVAGFGRTPAEATDDFNKNWYGQTLPERG